MVPSSPYPPILLGIPPVITPVRNPYYSFDKYLLSAYTCQGLRKWGVRQVMIAVLQSNKEEISQAIIHATRKHSGCWRGWGHLEQRLLTNPNETEKVSFQLVPERSVGINKVNWGIKGMKSFR